MVAPDLPADDDALALADYAEAVVAAVGDRRDLVFVGQSFGGFTASLVAALGFEAGMVPAAGESPEAWENPEQATGGRGARSSWFDESVVERTRTFGRRPVVGAALSSDGSTRPNSCRPPCPPTGSRVPRPR